MIRSSFECPKIQNSPRYLWTNLLGGQVSISKMTYRQTSQIPWLLHIFFHLVLNHTSFTFALLSLALDFAGRLGPGGPQKLLNHFARRNEIREMLMATVFGLSVNKAGDRNIDFIRVNKKQGHIHHNLILVIIGPKSYFPWVLIRNVSFNWIFYLMKETEKSDLVKKTKNITHPIGWCNNNSITNSKW